jgi:hypothetical protein
MRLHAVLIVPIIGLLVACGGSSDSPSIPGPGAPTPKPLFEGLSVVRYPMGATQSANPGSPFAGRLQDCAFSNTRADSCTFGELPLLGGTTASPTIDDVMDRVIVSHAWMAPRFRDVLERMPEDLLLLFRGVTAIVISSDVRPSFYWTATGAIYLDPETIWLTPSERATIPTTPDFRSDFGRDLQFAMPWRYVKDNAPAFTTVPYGQEQPRPIEAILVNIARLLYHELAHANDYFTPERQANRPASQLIRNGVANPNVSDDLTALMPLASNEMRALARVRFHGDTATAQQRAYTPADVAGFFAPDRATVFYNYASTREDLAMMFEILMMRIRYGVQMDTAVTNNPTGENVTGHDFIVEWGQRDRIGEPSIRERVRYVVARLLPELDLDAYIDALPEPIPMRAGESWTQNLNLGPDAGHKSHALDDFREHVHVLHGY